MRNFQGPISMYTCGTCLLTPKS
uniref:Uncharacterized protein n=1 Tax=Arundo donax TaxID=35708 RepID=A0A0A9CCX4_ARUDO